MKLLKICTLSLFLILFTTLLFEGYYKYFHHDKDNFWWNYPTKPIPPSSWWHATKDDSMVLLSTPKLDYTGQIPWEKEGQRNKNTIANIKSNEYGFFTPYNFKELINKNKDEFRIIIIGGSGAQGHGATENKKMFSYILEKKLNDHFKENKISVINLSSQGHESVNNLKVLREFGHDIKPDMIIAYNGANDLYQIKHLFKRNCNLSYENYMRSNFYNPSWIKKIGNYFPTLIYKTGFDRFIKQKFYSDFYKSLTMKNCYLKWDVQPEKINHYPTIYKKIVKPTFVRNFKSIKREFCGIPIALFFQPVHQGERFIYQQLFSELSVSNPPVYFMGEAKKNLRLNNPYKKTINISKYNSNKTLHSFKNETNKTIDISHLLSNNKIEDIENLNYNFINDNEEKVIGKIETLFELMFKEKNVYRDFYFHISSELNNFMNDDWLFFDLDKYFHDDKSFSSDKTFIKFLNHPKLMEDSIGIHLDDLGHQVVSKIIYLKIKDLIFKYINEKKINKCY